MIVLIKFILILSLLFINKANSAFIKAGTCKNLYDTDSYKFTNFLTNASFNGDTSVLSLELRGFALDNITDINHDNNMFTTLKVIVKYIDETIFTNSFRLCDLIKVDHSTKYLIPKGVFQGLDNQKDTLSANGTTIQSTINQPNFVYTLSSLSSNSSFLTELSNSTSNRSSSAYSRYLSGSYSSSFLFTSISSYEDEEDSQSSLPSPSPSLLSPFSSSSSYPPLSSSLSSSGSLPKLPRLPSLTTSFSSSSSSSTSSSASTTTSKKGGDDSYLIPVGIGKRDVLNYYKIFNKRDGTSEIENSGAFHENYNWGTCPIYKYNEILLSFVVDIPKKSTFGTYHVRFEIIEPDNDTTVIGCSTSDVSIVQPLALAWALTIGMASILALIAFSNVVAIVYSPYQDSKNSMLYIAAAICNAPLLNEVVPSFCDFFQYLNFMFFMSALNLNYPGYFSPLMTSLRWSALLDMTYGISSPSLNNVYQTLFTSGLNALSNGWSNDVSSTNWKQFMINFAITYGSTLSSFIIFLLISMLKDCYHSKPIFISKLLNNISILSLSSLVLFFLKLTSIPFIVNNLYLLSNFTSSNYISTNFYIQTQKTTHTASDYWGFAFAIMFLIAFILLNAFFIFKYIIDKSGRLKLYKSYRIMIIFQFLFIQLEPSKLWFYSVEILEIFLFSTSVGAIQVNGSAQLILITLTESFFLLSILIFKPYYSRTRMNRNKITVCFSKVVICFLHIPFSHNLLCSETIRTRLTWVILLLYLLVVLFLFLVPTIINLFVVFKLNWNYRFRENSKNVNQLSLMRNKEDKIGIPLFNYKLSSSSSPYSSANNSNNNEKLNLACSLRHRRLASEIFDSNGIENSDGNLVGLNQIKDISTNLPSSVNSLDNYSFMDRYSLSDKSFYTLNSEILPNSDNRVSTSTNNININSYLENGNGRRISTRPSPLSPVANFQFYNEQNNRFSTKSSVTTTTNNNNNTEHENTRNLYGLIDGSNGDIGDSDLIDMNSMLKPTTTTTTTVDSPHNDEGNQDQQSYSQAPDDISSLAYSINSVDIELTDKRVLPAVSVANSSLRLPIDNSTMVSGITGNKERIPGNSRGNSRGNFYTGSSGHLLNIGNSYQGYRGRFKINKKDYSTREADLYFSRYRNADFDPAVEDLWNERFKNLEAAASSNDIYNKTTDQSEDATISKTINEHNSSGNDPSGYNTENTSGQNDTGIGGGITKLNSFLNWSRLSKMKNSKKLSTIEDELQPKGSSFEVMRPSQKFKNFNKGLEKCDTVYSEATTLNTFSTTTTASNISAINAHKNSVKAEIRDNDDSIPQKVSSPPQYSMSNLSKISENGKYKIKQSDIKSMNNDTTFIGEGDGEDDMVSFITDDDVEVDCLDSPEKNDEKRAANISKIYPCLNQQYKTDNQIFASVDDNKRPSALSMTYSTGDEFSIVSKSHTLKVVNITDADSPSLSRNTPRFSKD